MKLATLLALVVSIGYAGPISTLFNTGAGLNSAPVGTADPNWTVNSNAAYVTDSSGFPFGSWPADSSESTWISPQPSYTSNQSDASGYYIFTTQFDMTGYDAANATITTSFASDDWLLSIVLNGNVVGLFGWNPGFAFSAPFTFGGLAPGDNQLDFIVYNLPLAPTHNPAGINVQFWSDATPLNSIPEGPPSEAPEPFTVLVVGSGLVLLGILRKEAIG